MVVEAPSSPLPHRCPLCGPTTLQWRFEKKGRQFWRCPRCGIEMQHPLPTRTDLEAYYNSQYANGMYSTFAAESEMKSMTARQRLSEIASTVPPAGRWLDVGSSNGVFVREARALRIDAEGLELSGVAVAQAREAGLPVNEGALEDLPASPDYDCITAFDVVEHVIDPLAFLEQIVQRLRAGGHAVLTMPDKSSLYCRLMGRRWWFYIPEEHLHYFDPGTMRALLAKVGLEPIEVSRTYKPLTFNYGMTQFIEYNPLIFRAMQTISRGLPSRLRERVMTLYIGEMKVIARKPTVSVPPSA